MNIITKQFKPWPYTRLFTDNNLCYYKVYMYTKYGLYCTYHCMIASPSLVCLDRIFVASTFAPSYVFKPRSLRVN